MSRASFVAGVCQGSSWTHLICGGYLIVRYAELIPLGFGLMLMSLG